MTPPSLAFPPRPRNAEAAGSMDGGAGGQRCRRKEAMAWYHRTCAMSSPAEEFGWKNPHLQSQNLLDWIGLMKTCGGPRVSCALMSVSPHVTIGKQSPVDVENTCLEPVTSALSRLVMAEMQHFSNAVQGSWAFQENFQCRPVLFSLNEKWCGGNINQQVRILFLNWKMNIFLVISQLKLYVDIVQFLFSLLL